MGYTICFLFFAALLGVGLGMLKETREAEQKNAIPSCVKEYSAKIENPLNFEVLEKTRIFCEKLNNHQP